MCDKLSKYIPGFRKFHGTQHSLLVILEKNRKALDKRENVCTIFMDLSNVFDSLTRDLLLAKQKAYRFSENTLNLMCSYLKDRRQSVQINNLSSYKKVQAGVPQESIDGSLLFNQFINDLVLFLSEKILSNYADNNNLHSIGKKLNIIKEKLQKDFTVITDWFF